jgi:hypothetical protein
VCGTAVAAVLALAATGAQAAYLKFDDLPPLGGGTISYSGLAGDVLYGANIELDTVQGFDTPSANGVSLTCVGCQMNFYTGANLVEGTPQHPVWTFDVGGFLTISGTLVTTTNAVVATGDLLSGTFDTAGLAVNQGTGAPGNPPPQTAFFGGTVAAVLDPSLATYFGLDFLGLGSVTALYIQTSFDFSTKAFSGAVTDASSIYVANPIPNAIVPVPPAVLLLGAGFLGYLGVGYTRRRGEEAAVA